MNLPLLLEPADLAALSDTERGKILVVDVCQTQTWQRMHIPGAVHLPPARLVSGQAPAAGKLPSEASLADIFSDIGYQPDTHIVVYDDEGGGWAGRFLWTLDVIGHKHSSVLNGGLHAWAKEGHPLENTPVEVVRTEARPRIDTDPIAEVPDMLAAIADTSVCIWDARSVEEYQGQRMTALRNGHIPGAINVDWMELMDHERNLRLLPDEALLGLLQSKGITPGKRIITHCHSHHRSGLSYLAARQLGFPVKAYHGSWSEWGNLPDTPIEGPDQ